MNLMNRKCLDDGLKIESYAKSVSAPCLGMTFILTFEMTMKVQIIRNGFIVTIKCSGVWPQ